MPTESIGTEVLVSQIPEPPVPLVADSAPATAAPLHSATPKTTDSARSPLVSDEELMAARAGQEGSGTAAGRLASLDEARPGGTAPGASGDSSAGASTPAAPDPACRRPQFRIPSPGTRCDASVPKQAAEVTEAPRRGAPRRGWIAPLARQVYRTADAALDLVNRPFSWLTGEARNMLGWWALATMAVALSSWLLLPVLLPNRDALTFLKEKRTAIDRSPAAEVAPAGGGSVHGGGGHH
jgi:hypothetical protein